MLPRALSLTPGPRLSAPSSSPRASEPPASGLAATASHDRRRGSAPPRALASTKGSRGHPRTRCCFFPTPSRVAVAERTTAPRSPSSAIHLRANHRHRAASAPIFRRGEHLRTLPSLPMLYVSRFLTSRALAMSSASRGRRPWRPPRYPPFPAAVKAWPRPPSSPALTGALGSPFGEP